MSDWELITGEFPPQRGGVSDYVWNLAEGLANAGDTVRVWCPGNAAPLPPATSARVQIHRSLGRLRPADLRAVGRELNELPAPRRLLVQWVPHSFGLRSLNLPFCLWLLDRSRRHGDRVEIMVHEPYLPFGRFGARHNLAAAIHRLMVVVLLRAADRVWVSTPAWSRRWSRYALGRAIPFAWIPIPSSVPVVDDPEGTALVRVGSVPAGVQLIGHFGTYRPVVASLLAPILEAVLARSRANVLLLGRGGEEFREELIRRNPRLATRISATGGLEAADLSRAIQACDLMIQPYPDGVNGRQSSMAALLAHGRAIVTTRGASTEEIWRDSAAAVIVPVDEPEAATEAVMSLLEDEGARTKLAEAARELYRSRFDLRHTIAALRAGD